MYKELFKNDTLIDCIENPCFVKWQDANGLFIACKEEEAEGIVSSDGARIYKLKDVFSYGRYPFGEVSCISVSKKQFDIDKETIPNTFGADIESYNAIIDDYTLYMIESGVL